MTDDIKHAVAQIDAALDPLIAHVRNCDGIVCGICEGCGDIQEALVKIRRNVSLRPDTYISL